MSSVLGQHPLAGWFSLSALQWSQGCLSPSHFVSVLWLPAPDFGYAGTISKILRLLLHHAHESKTSPA